jgi:hypothetical protein
MIHLVHQRLRYRKGRTPGELLISGQRICFTVEDELRELPGVPVGQWKKKNDTAIPAGQYVVALVDSPTFGKDTLTLRDVPGFDLIRVHSGNDEEATRGCPLVGSELDGEDKIPYGKTRGALKELKERLVPALKAGEVVIWDTRNPEGWQGPPSPRGGEESLPPLPPLPKPIGDNDVP